VQTRQIGCRLLAFQFAVLRAKVRGTVAAAYFGMRPVILSPRRNPRTQSDRKVGCYGKFLKFGHEELGERSVRAGSEQGQKNEVEGRWKRVL